MDTDDAGLSLILGPMPIVDLKKKEVHQTCASCSRQMVRHLQSCSPYALSGGSCSALSAYRFEGFHRFTDRAHP